MTARLLKMGLVLLATLAMDARNATAQISGRVILREGPIALDVAIGRRPHVSVVRHRAPRGRVVEVHQPRRYEPGMTFVELERYLHWVEVEYRTFRRMDEDEAWYRFGWSERQLDDYVDWLKDERKYLKREHKRLRRLIRDGHRYAPYDGWRGDWDDGDWEDYWDDRYDDWEDRREDWDDEWEDRYKERADDDDRRRRRSRGR
ncbi:MAG: hypothetical protein AAF389_07375 [Gemmatimonadota bacterium]